MNNGRTNILQRHPGLRWLVPALVLALVVTVPAVGRRVASADPGLPPRSAEQLLTDLAEATPVAMSGTVQQTMNLGLPTLPQLDSGPGGFSPLSLLTGDATWRVWTNASDSVRVARVNGSNELVLVRNPRETWVWDSATREAVHTAHDHDKQPTTRPSSTPETPTPAEVAKQVLAALDPTTEVTTDTATTVAGRDAYQLVLTPTQAGTTIGQVRLAIDAETKLPLRVLVTAKGGGSPAVQVAFTSISYQAPDTAVFTFTPPADATVRESDEAPTEQVPTEKPDELPQPTDVTRRVVGQGWAQVLVVEGLGDLTDSQDPAITQLLGQFPTVQGDWGQGRLVTSTLVNAVITTDGRLAIGAVTPQLLYAALQ